MAVHRHFDHPHPIGVGVAKAGQRAGDGGVLHEREAHRLRWVVWEGGTLGEGLLIEDLHRARCRLISRLLSVEHRLDAGIEPLPPVAGEASEDLIQRRILWALPVAGDAEERRRIAQPHLLRHLAIGQPLLLHDISHSVATRRVR